MSFHSFIFLNALVAAALLVWTTGWSENQSTSVIRSTSVVVVLTEQDVVLNSP